MKKKFKITESQAQMMLNEADINKPNCKTHPKECWFCKPGSPCKQFATMNANFTAAYTGQKYPTQSDCEANSECKPTRGDNGDKKRYHCEGGTCHVHPSGQYTTLQDCEDNCGDPTGGGKTKKCTCCKKGENGQITGYNVPTTIPVSDSCSQFDTPPSMYGCAESTVWDVKKCDPRGNDDGGCPDIECKNPNHVQGPPPECKCECPEGSGEKGCKKGSHWSPDECCCVDSKTGDCVPDNTSFVGPLYTENKTELSEEIKRIKQLLK